MKFSLAFFSRPGTIISQLDKLNFLFPFLTFLLCVAVTYIMSFAAPIGIFALLFVMGQWAAYGWYLTSFFPKGLYNLLSFD